MACSEVLTRISVPTIAVRRLVSIIGIGNKLETDLTCSFKVLLRSHKRILANGNREFRISTGADYRRDRSYFGQLLHAEHLHFDQAYPPTLCAYLLRYSKQVRPDGHASEIWPGTR